MISKLTGTVDRQSFLESKEGSLTFDVRGVGYEVFCSAVTRSQLPENEQTSLYIETHVREDRIQLFGFYDLIEKQVFKKLVTVQGVGMKAAMAILSALSSHDVLEVIQTQNAKALTQADGIGPKIANRIVSELSDKMSDLFENSFSPISPSEIVMKANFANNHLSQDAISALVNLGYKDNEARQIVSLVIKKHENAEDLKIDDVIRMSLQEINSSLR